MKTTDDLVDLLRKRPGLCCTEIGESLWGKRYRVRQCYARPAGKLAKRAIAEGKVREAWEKTCGGFMRRVFYATGRRP